MIYTDILLAENYCNTVIMNSFSQIFAIKHNEIYFISNVEDFPEKGKYKIVCQNTYFNEGLPLLLSIYIFDEKCLTQYAINDFCINLSNLLKTNCYLPSNNENPYELLKYLPTGQSEIVFLNPDVLDTQGKYIINH